VECYIQTLGHEVGWPNKVFKAYLRDRYMFHYAVRGKAYFDGYPVKEGQFFFSYPYQSYDFYEDKDDPMEIYYIALAGKNAKNLIDALGFDKVSRISDFDFADVIKTLFHDALYVEHPNVDLELYLYSMFLKIMSYHKPKNLNIPGNPGKDESSSYSYYKTAIEYINDNCFVRNISPSDVANVLHISPSYLRLIFDKYCKLSCRELIIRKRLEYAANRILFDNYSIKEAAISVGYEDYRLFSRIFKKYIGTTPKEFRQRKQQVKIVPVHKDE